MDQQLYARAVMFITGLDKRYAMNNAVGWVYAMRNREFRKPLLKIGMTRHPPPERARQLASATGVPGHFDLVYFVHVSHRVRAEAYVHEQLAAYRTSPTTEFFEVPIATAVGALDEAATRFPINWI